MGRRNNHDDTWESGVLRGASGRRCGRRIRRCKYRNRHRLRRRRRQMRPCRPRLQPDCLRADVVYHPSNLSPRFRRWSSRCVCAVSVVAAKHVSAVLTRRVRAREGNGRLGFRWRVWCRRAVWVQVAELAVPQAPRDVLQALAVVQAALALGEHCMT